MDNQTIAKIIEALCAVAERTEMLKDEEEYYDMAVGLLSIMLEEQKVKTTMINGNGRNGRCPRCLNSLNEMDYPCYCGFCGQAVKWDSD